MSERTILVTGASRGIGRAVALKFAEKNRRIAICCRTREDLLLETQKAVEAAGASCLACVCDVGDWNSCQEMFDRIRRHFGTVDILVNNAGISHVGLLQDMSAEQWDRVIRTNLTSVFYLCKLVIPGMVARKSGKIINISSVWGQAGASCEAAYSASKGGMDALTRALAKELAPSSIQVNALSCGLIDTEMNRFLGDEERELLTEQIPAGRMGRADEVADTVFRLTEINNYMTGQVIRIDGGWI